jgi:hypothetical protein
MEKKIEKGDLLRCLRRALAKMKDNRDPHYYDLVTNTVQELVREFPQGFPPDADLRDIANQGERYGFAVPFVEGYSYLQSLGYIVNEFNGLNPPKPAQFRITELGSRWAQDNGNPAPEDENCYLLTLKTLVPHSDPIVEQYMEEAVRAYARQMYFASAVMIGAASEKCVYLLMTALASAITDAHEKITVKNAISARGLPNMFSLLLKNLSKSKKTIPWDIYEGVDCHIVSFQEAVRVQRNAAVHPDAGQVSPEQVRLMLSCFPAAYKKLHSLTAWLASNKI